MHSYRVVQRSPADGRFGMRCHMGRFHVARSVAGIPAVEAILHGDKPHVGFGMLSCAQSGRIYRVVFESVNQAAIGRPATRPWAAAPAP